MPWDHFCAACGTLLEGGMADGDEMDREMKAFAKQLHGLVSALSAHRALAGRKSRNWPTKGRVGPSKSCIY